jgi:hypothetical protein
MKILLKSAVSDYIDQIVNRSRTASARYHATKTQRRLVPQIDDVRP